MEMKNRYIGFTYAVFTVLVIVFFVWAFYFSPLGEKVENELYDFRTKIKPNIVPTKGVVVLTVNEKTIKRFEGKSGQQINLSTLEAIVEAAKRTNAASINIVVTTDILFLGRRDKAGLVHLVQGDKRIRLGVLGMDSDIPTPREIPLPLRYIDGQMFSVNSFKTRTTDTVRKLPMWAYRGRELRPSLPAAVGGIGLKDLQSYGELYINYAPPADLEHVDAYDFVNDPTNNQRDFKDTHIFLSYGQIDNRRHLAVFSYVNTPWNEEDVSLLNGTYLTDFVAICSLNYLHKNFLKPCPVWFIVLQTLALAAVFGLVWRLGSTWAFILILLGWYGTLYLHGVAFSVAGVFIPFGDTALFAILAGIVGGQWRLTQETKLRLEQEAETHTQQEIARVQTRFLDRYADGLETMNENILGQLATLEEEMNEVPRLRPAYIKLLSSCEELRDYLSGIKQFSAVGQEGASFVNKTVFAVAPMIDKVVHQFDSKIEDRKIAIRIECDEKLKLHSDETILGHIIFNLVSNAIKYTRVGGEVGIEAKHSGRDVVFTVSDNGPGIAEEYQDQIFEKFFRVKDDMNIEVKGHGLGLYLSKYFVESLDGSISVSSELGQGAQFRIILRGAAQS